MITRFLDAAAAVYVRASRCNHHDGMQIIAIIAF